MWQLSLKLTVRNLRLFEESFIENVLIFFSHFWKFYLILIFWWRSAPMKLSSRRLKFKRVCGNFISTLTYIYASSFNGFFNQYLVFYKLSSLLIVFFLKEFFIIIFYGIAFSISIICIIKSFFFSFKYFFEAFRYFLFKKVYLVRKLEILATILLMIIFVVMYICKMFEEFYPFTFKLTISTKITKLL